MRLKSRSNVGALSLPNTATNLGSSVSALSKNGCWASTCFRTACEPSSSSLRWFFPAGTLANLARSHRRRGGSRRRRPTPQSLEEVERYTRGAAPEVGGRRHGEAQMTNVESPTLVGLLERKAQWDQMAFLFVALPRGLEPLFSP